MRGDFDEDEYDDDDWECFEDTCVCTDGMCGESEADADCGKIFNGDEWALAFEEFMTDEGAVSSDPSLRLSQIAEEHARIDAVKKLAAAEARCTALQQQLAAADKVWVGLAVLTSCTSPDGSAELDAVAYQQERIAKAEKELADLRGSITRLIAQWREDHASRQSGGDYDVLECADELEAALTPQGEAQK